ncbi:hypothetical protein HN018_10760 [Lichenicola cladoniae]|uniref:Glycosyltransferase n=1 Tax=Lichenicola cladoniae TaxID=1484109 RepID=A0A6M8HQE2_9PROT|nr:hypothetical protein [Lichenicola cladoniae]NPD67847.1 hypothetical protein [Acetobacteraceae bacterium]QKE90451.1 hypothetical protein HN018_10760 [Lichenicola cladoniae]
MRPHIFVATPCYGGVVGQGYMQSVCALMATAPAAGLDLTLALLGQDALITRCRNTLVGHFVAQPGATHILFVDADISFEPEQVFRLLRAAKPIAAGIYPLKTYHWDRACRDRAAAGEEAESAGLHYVGEPEPAGTMIRDGDFVTGISAGTGFMLIERTTIAALSAAHPETRYRGTHAYSATMPAATDNHALFDCQINPQTGIYMSEDFTFCHRWRKLGGEIWLDTGSRLTHTGPSDFHGVPDRRFATTRPPG